MILKNFVILGIMYFGYSEIRGYSMIGGNVLGESLFKNQCIEFMFIFMYELEKLLRENKEEMKNLNFSSDEANIDREFKVFTRNLILNNLTSLSDVEDVFVLQTNNNEKIFDLDKLKKIQIKEVYLPEMITEDIKEKIRRPNKIYTNPDLLLELTNLEYTTYKSIELKSTKTKVILGSSIKQINLLEWGIFVKRSMDKGAIKELEIQTGRYLDMLTTKINFPDRNPRPEISYKTLKEWNKKNKIIHADKVIFIKDENEEKEKEELLNCWELKLAEKWVDNVFEEPSKKKEAWFKDNLRIFVLKFLQQYESLDEVEKREYKEMLENYIEKF